MYTLLSEGKMLEDVKALLKARKDNREEELEDYVNINIDDIDTELQNL